MNKHTHKQKRTQLSQTRPSRGHILTKGSSSAQEKMKQQRSLVAYKEGCMWHLACMLHQQESTSHIGHIPSHWLMKILKTSPQAASLNNPCLGERLYRSKGLMRPGNGCTTEEITCVSLSVYFITLLQTQTLFHYSVQVPSHQL